MSQLAKLLKSVSPPANPANSANPEALISKISSISKGKIAKTNSEQAMEARRELVLKMLASHPDNDYAWLTVSDADQDHIILVGAIRGAATFELSIPREDYDHERLRTILGFEHVSVG